MKKIPNAIYWFFTADTIRDKNYIKAVDYVKNNTEFDFMCVIMQAGVVREDFDQCHDMMAELVTYAHARGIGIGLTLSASRGFYNPGFDPNVAWEKGQLELFSIAHPENAQALVQEQEIVLDEEGKATFEHHEYGARSKVRPLYNKLIKLYAFYKTGEGFYKRTSLCDITKCAQIIQSRTHMMEVEINAGIENSGKTVYAMVAQYYNWPELFGASDWEERKALMDIYADIPMDGYAMDEYGYMLLDISNVINGKLPPFRSRFYSPAQKKYYLEKLNIDLDRMLFDMRYAPTGEEGVRIRAINYYFDHLRVPILEEEHRVAEYAQMLWGKDVYLGIHNTFHNHLDNDEIWHTACAWWDLPRHFGHTDEYLSYPLRMGILMAADDPRMIHMSYHCTADEYFTEIAHDAPFNIRIFKHALDDFYWGSSFREPELVEGVRKLDLQIKRLDEFQTAAPKTDLLIIFGYMAQVNWYPDYEARNMWDIDGKLKIEEKCNAIWDAGYRAAAVPDYAISDGRVELKDGKLTFHGHEFSYCLFLYPKYAKKSVYEFLNKAYSTGFPIAIVGKGEIDFDAEPNHLDASCYEEFSLDILKKMGCKKLAIPDGCAYANGGFCIMRKDGILNGEAVLFDFMLDDVRYHGINTGMVAYRKGDAALATEGSKLYENNQEIALNYN